MDFFGEELDWEPKLLISNEYTALTDPNEIIVGVYAGVCLENHKKYIGSSYDMRSRLLWGHVSKLERFAHSNKKLTEAFHQYKFNWYLVEPTLRGEEKNQEQYYLDLWKPFPWTGRGYNLTESAFYKICPDGEEFNSRESKEDRGRRLRGTSEPLRFRNPNGEIIETFFTCSEFAKQQGLERHAFLRLVSRDMDSYKGWTLADTVLPEKRFYRVLSPEGEIFSFDVKKKFAEEHGLNIGDLGYMVEGRGQKFSVQGWTSLDFPPPEKESRGILICPEGKEWPVYNIKKFADDRGLTAGKVGELINRKILYYRGWRLNTTPEFLSTIHIFTNPDGKNIETSNIAELERQYNMSKGSMGNITSGKNKTNNGWSYKGIKINSQNENSNV